MDVKIQKKLIIELDIINGGIELNNEDDMSYIEILGVLEYVKMMLMEDWGNTD